MQSPALPSVCSSDHRNPKHPVFSCKGCTRHPKSPEAPWRKTSLSQMKILLLGRTVFGSPNSIYLSNPKNGHQTNRTVQNYIILRILQFLGKTQQLKTSKLAQNCGKTAVLHPSLLTESAGIMKSKLFPQCKQRIHPVLHIYYYSLTGWYWTPGDIHNPTRKVAAFGV